MAALLGKDKQNIEVSDDEVLQRLETFPEPIIIADLTEAIKRTPPYKWGTPSSNDLVWNLSTWS